MSDNELNRHDFCRNMMTETRKNENISALLDGEIDDVALDAILTDMDSTESKDVWGLYHHIGDVLRSDDLATPLSTDFNQRFAARFASEPAILMPKMHVKNEAKESDKPQYLRSYLSVATAAVAALFAFVFVPQLLQLNQNQLQTVQVSEIVSPKSANKLQLASAPVTPDLSTKELAQVEPAVESSKQVNERQTAPVEMLRDPRIDSYLIAHQKFSPAISAGTQYVTRANAVSGPAEK
jgi:sigma-E factor negative regulatory protein RseA